MSEDFAGQAVLGAHTVCPRADGIAGGQLGSKGFLNEGVLNRVALTRSIFNEYYIRTIDQVGVSALVGLMGNVYLEGNLGYLKSRGSSACFRHADH
jgi:hypothetical protein